MLSILVDHIDNIRGAQEAHSKEEDGDEGGENSEYDDHLIVELQHVGSIAFTVVAVRKLCDLNYVVNGPEAICYIVVSIQKEETVLHRDVVRISEFEIDHQTEEYCWPQYTHNKMYSM